MEEPGRLQSTGSQRVKHTERLHFHFHFQITGREHSSIHQQKIVLKIYWAWTHPSEQDPVSPSVLLSHQEAFISLLSFKSEDRQTENYHHRNLTNLHEPQPSLTHWNYEPYRVWPHKADGSWWRVLTVCGPLEKGMANHFSILALRTPWTICKGKMIGHWKMNSPDL